MSDPRSAVVTGASRGIGLAIARGLVRRGARVAMLARNANALEAAAGDLGPLALPIACDIGDAAQTEAALALVRAELGDAPDVVVNNAGLFVLTRVHETDPDEFARALHVNLAGAFRVVRAFLPGMRKRGAGHVVTVGSIADHTAFPENGAYSASKYGLRGLHEVLRTELVGTGVRATLISPGPVDTALWDAIDRAAHSGLPEASEMLPADAVADAVLYAITQQASVNVDEIRISRS